MYKIITNLRSQTMNKLKYNQRLQHTTKAYRQTVKQLQIKNTDFYTYKLKQGRL